MVLVLVGPLCACACVQRLLSSMPHLEYAVRRSGGACYLDYLDCLPPCSDRRWAALHLQYGGQYAASTQATEVSAPPSGTHSLTSPPAAAAVPAANQAHASPHTHVRARPGPSPSRYRRRVARRPPAPHAQDCTLASIFFACVYLACKVVDTMPMLDMLRYMLTHLYGSLVSRAQAYDVESKCLEVRRGAGGGAATLVAAVRSGAGDAHKRADAAWWWPCVSRCAQGLGFRLGPYFSTDELRDDWPF